MRPHRLAGDDELQPRPLRRAKDPSVEDEANHVVGEDVGLHRHEEQVEGEEEAEHVAEGPLPYLSVRRTQARGESSHAESPFSPRSSSADANGDAEAKRL